MASDLSSGCTDDIDIFEEKEEGELSLEDVSSSEESHPNYRSGYRTAGRCPTCMALQICAPWCEAARAARKTHKKQDAAHGKENRRHIKDPSGTVPKHMVATLQEKNDDLVPISSDSDMEIVGLPGNSKQLHTRSKSAKVRKKKKKKRGHSSVVRIDDSLSPAQVETYVVDVPVVKKVHTSRSHHRELSPPRYSVRSPLERTLPSRRYRTTRQLKSRSPLRRSRSPAPRVNSAERKSPRKLRSPRRSPVSRSPVRSTIVRDARDHASPLSSQTHIDMYATKLLKKVRRLESVGGISTNNLSKNKEHSSLKEKLSNMMKNQAEGSHEKHSVMRKSNNTNVINNNNNTSNGIAAVVESDDEDDIELLRRLALETKQNKAENKIEETKIKSESANADESDDNDIEANELRILALRSAIMKKHEKRVTRGMKSKRPVKSATRVESPFNESFLDEIDISGEEESGITSPATKSSPILDYESNHPEDMDIDTDVEREKEKDLMPYSPTDDLTREIVMEVELLETNDINNEKERLSVMQREKNVTNERNTSPENSDYMPGVNNPYSPSVPTETPNSHKFISNSSVNNDIVEIALENAENSSSLKNSDCAIEEGVSYYLPGVDTSFSPARTIEMPQSEKSQSQVQNIANTETPYSPTDTPILDPHLFPIFPNLPVVQPAIDSIEKIEDNESSASKMEEVDNAVVKNVATMNEAINEVVAFEALKTNLPPEEVEKCESPSTIVGLDELTIRETLFKPIDTMDKLPEVDLDGSPLVPESKELENAMLVIPIKMSPEIDTATNSAVEPLYLQSLSDDTKDTNKIPTLVNRTLVPALILKSNKQLQQPLPQKKVDNHTEPSFKSAEMKPVIVDAAQVKLTTMFKPIKLCPISKKSQVMTTTVAAAFNTSFGDDSIKETKSDNEDAAVDVPALDQETKTIASNSPGSEISQEVDDSSEQKKKANSRIKRRWKLRDKRKSSDVAESSDRESNRESIGIRAKSAQSYLSNYSRKKGKSIGSASESNERVTRSSIKTLFLKSRKSFNDNPVDDDKYTQREASNVKNDKATASKNETGQVEDKIKRSPKKTRRSKKKVKRLSNSSTDTRNKSSDLDITMSNEHTADKSSEKEQMETNKNEEDQSTAVQTSNKLDETERKRRCSIDEDEEALRALLLASLPKRTKPAEAGLSTPPENAVGTIPALLDTTMGMSVKNSTKPTVSTGCLVDTVKPGDALTLSNQSSNASSATQIKVEVAAASTTTKYTEEARKILGSESNSSSVEASPLTLRKRANSVVVKGPPKKIAKKALPVLASTKVVNNAKKYQNALMQKKLNLQRAAMNYSAQNGSRNITLNNLKNNDAARPSSPKISAASKTQRLVINLGSDTDSEAELESHQTANSNNGEAQAECRKPLAIPTTDFEKSVVQFLKDQRKKLESVTVPKAPASSTTPTIKTVANTASPATGKLSGLYNTPLAVRRHLPMSQQEEYRRLKQQIAEREREKLRKTIENGSASSLKSPCTPPGPLSPASPIAAIQKTQTNNKVSGIVTEVATSSLAPSNKDKTLEKPIVQKKIELVKANENRLAINVTKASKIISTPPNPNKQITKPLAASSKVNSNVPNNASTATAPKAPVKVVPKSSSSIPISSIPAITSTPKAQLSISSKAQSNISSRTYLPKQVDPTAEISGKSRSSLKPTEMLTIQIPNDKIQTDRGTLTRSSRGESSSPPNGRNVGMLKILTKEQLNSRFIQIQVKQGPAGRKVTVGGSTLSHDNATRSASSSPTSRVFPDGRSDQSDKKTCCDSSLIVNESTVTRRGVEKMEESMVADSEASTLVLSRDEGNSRKNRSDDSEASTFVVVHENAHNDRNTDSEASTLVLGHDNSEGRDSPGMTRTEESEDGALAGNAGGVMQNKLQDKEVWEKIKSDVKNELEILTALPPDQQRNILVESQENLVAKRNMVLDDLTEMSGCLRQWEVEREIQTKLIEEVRRLQDQLRTAEKHLREQRRQMNGMGPRVSKAYEKISYGRQECYKLSRICHGLGTKLMGEEYKVPDTGAQLLTDRLTEVAVHTRQLSKKKVPPIDSLIDSRDTNSPASSTASDTVLENSFVERPSNSTTPLLLSYTTNIGESTSSLPSAKLVDFDDTGKTRGNSEPPPEISTEDSPCSNPISERMDVTIEEEEEEEEKSSETHAQLEEETIASNSTEQYAQKKDNERSSSSETNAQMMEKAEPKFLKIDPQMNIEEASCFSEDHTNYNSDVAMTNLFSIGRYEDISMPSTSKSEAHCELLSSDDQPPVKSKIDPYKSVLTHLKAPRSVNPDGILCPYELMGTCSDGDCQFYHLDPGHCQ